MANYTKTLQGSSSESHAGRANPTVRVNASGTGDARVEPGVEIDGFEQVFEMLKAADASFRESLLTRLAQRDRTLAQSLRHRLGRSDK